MTSRLFIQPMLSEYSQFSPVLISLIEVGAELIPTTVLNLLLSTPAYIGLGNQNKLTV